MRRINLIIETTGSGSEHKVENPKAFVFVAFDSLVVTKNCDSIGESVVINVDETGAEEGDCGFDGIDGDGDIDGKAGCG